MSAPRILVAGIGNIFLGDDAFGVEVAQRLLRRPRPDGVRVTDFGIRGFDLAYALMDDELDVALLVDAFSRGEPPGTLFVIEPDLDALEDTGGVVETHGMHPLRVLNLVTALGGRPPRVLVVGCEPATLDPDEEGRLGLSEPLAAVLDAAVELVESLVAQLLREGRRAPEPGVPA
jgi:hydrogenase maturation protease